MGRQAGADRCWRVVRQWEQLLRGEAALASGVAAEVAIRTSERIPQDHPSSFARDGLGDRGNTVGIGMRLGAVPLHFMPLQLLRAIILSMKKKCSFPNRNTRSVKSQQGGGNVHQPEVWSTVTAVWAWRKALQDFKSKTFLPSGHPGPGGFWFVGAFLCFPPGTSLSSKGPPRPKWPQKQYFAISRPWGSGRPKRKM